MSKIFIFIGVMVGISLILGVMLSKDYAADKTVIGDINPKITKSNKAGSAVDRGGVNRQILQTVIDDSSLSFGPENALITIVEFSGFGCRFSRQAFSIIREIQATYPNKIRYIYKHFPLQEIFEDKETKKAAEASECAHDQGKFFLMHDKLFQNQERLSIGDIKKYAKEIGLDERQFNTCLDSNKYSGRVEKDIEAGVNLGVAGTPTWFINGEMIEGVIPLEIFKAGIEKMIR